METHYEEFKHPNMMSMAESQNFQMVNGVKVYVPPEHDEKSHFDPLDYEQMKSRGAAYYLKMFDD